MNLPCNSLKATSFIMPNEREKKVKVVAGGESSRLVEGSVAAPVIGVSFTGQFPLNFPIVHEAVVGEEARRPVGDEGTEADDESQIKSIGVPLSIANCCRVQIRGRQL